MFWQTNAGSRLLFFCEFVQFAWHLANADLWRAWKMDTAKKKKNSALRTMMKIHSAALWIVNFQRLHLEIWQKDVAYNLRYGVLFAPIILHNFHLICNIAVFAEVDVDAPLRPARSSDNWNRSQCCWCWCCFFLPLSGRTQQNCNVKLEIHNHLCWFQNHNLCAWIIRFWSQTVDIFIYWLR